MMPLLTQCLLDDNGEAWTELWVVFDRTAAGPLRRILTFYDFDQREADAVVMDVWRHLLEDKRKRLASFKGNSQRELKSWLVRIAVNFAHDWICRRLTADRHERVVLSKLTVPDRSGPTEHELTRLEYPLRHGHQWVVIDDAFLMTATVEGREVLDLPIGRTPGWRIRLESDIFGPDDEVYLFYSRLGYLGWRLMVASEVIGDDGESMGTLWFTDEEYLQDVEIDRKAELPCDAASSPTLGVPQASL